MLIIETPIQLIAHHTQKMTSLKRIKKGERNYSSRKTILPIVAVSVAVAVAVVKNRSQ